MGQWRPVSNLRDQVSRHPPVVVFFLSLLILSITFLCIGLYSQNHNIKNPDVSVDWNRVLGSIAGFKFCTHLNDTNAPKEEDSPRMVEHSDKTNISTSSAHVSLLVPLAFIGDVPDNTAISATMLGSQMGMKGAAAKASVNISLLLHTDITDNQTPAGTQRSRPLTCLHFTALTHVFPQTPSPPECPVSESKEKSAPPVRAAAVEEHKHNSPHCFSLNFTPDPRLTVLLTKDEKALCMHHLMLASAALLVICVLVTLCGTFPSRSPRSFQGLDLQKESLLSQ
ncbi:transmembrane protein 248 [Puntigrus tetrazona]|uniref:transmembrane protein 248 n=1 Tax=Puntigrus tetrazona TaxID=1606681 RepID=UPI001C8939AC|nr:transmembrane protein 248 [Puntigrus tetrazona]